MTFTESELQSAREYAAQNSWAMAEEALTADYYADHVTMTDRERIKKEWLKNAKDIESGLLDHNFTIVQRMHYYLTGECPALLP